MTAITRFRGRYGFLSNFYSSPIEVNGITFPTVEHAFQAAKVCLKVEGREAVQAHIAKAGTPALAKKAGRMVPLRADWKQNHLAIMRRLLALKFNSGPLRDALMDTGELPLIEGNDWNDTYWGVCNGKGRNQLGVLLMEQRKALWDYFEKAEHRIEDAVEHERALLTHQIEDDPRLLRFADQDGDFEQREAANQRLVDDMTGDPEIERALRLHDQC